MELLTIRELTVAYKNHPPILSKLNLKVPLHQISAIRGANGTGKSTLIGVLAGLIPRFTGEILFLGEPWGENTRRRSAFVFDRMTFPALFNAKQILKIFAMGSIGKTQAAETLDLFKLDPEKPFFLYSKGMRQRLGIALALMKNPEFLILDEAFSSIDKATKETIFSHLHTKTCNGRLSVLMTTHSSEDCKRWADYEIDIAEAQKLPV